MVTARKSTKVAGTKPSAHGVSTRRKRLPTTKKNSIAAGGKSTEQLFFGELSTGPSMEDDRDFVGVDRCEKQVESREGTPPCDEEAATRNDGGAPTATNPKKGSTPAKGKRTGKSTALKELKTSQSNKEQGLKEKSDQEEDHSGENIQLLFSDGALDDGLKKPTNLAFTSSFDQREVPQGVTDYQPLNEQMGPPSPIHNSMGLGSVSFEVRGGLPVAEVDMEAVPMDGENSISARIPASGTSEINKIIGCDEMMGVRQEEWDILNQDSFGFNLGQGTLSLSFSSDNLLPYTESALYDTNFGNQDEGGNDTEVETAKVSYHKNSVDLTSAVTESTDSYCNIKPASTEALTADLKKSYSYNQSTQSNLIPKTPPSTHSAPAGPYHHHSRYRHSSRSGRKRHPSREVLESRNDSHHSRRQHDTREEIEGGSYIYDHRAKCSKFYPSPSNFGASKSDEPIDFRPQTHRSSHRSDYDRSRRSSSKRSSRSNYHGYRKESNIESSCEARSSRHYSHSPPPVPNVESAPSPISSWSAHGKRYKSSSSSGRHRPTSRERSYHGNTISTTRSHPQPPSSHHSSVASDGRASSWEAASSGGDGPRRPHARYPDRSASNVNGNSHYYPPPPPTASYHPPHHELPPPPQRPPSSGPPGNYPPPNYSPPMGYPYPPHPHHHPVHHSHPSQHPGAPAPIPAPRLHPSNGMNENDTLPNAFLPPPPPQYAPPPKSEPPREVYIRPSPSTSHGGPSKPPHYSHHPHPPPHPGAPPVLHHPPSHHSPYHHPPPNHYHVHHVEHRQPMPQPALTGAALLRSHNGGPPLTREQAPGIGWPSDEDMILTDVMANHKSPVDWEVIAREHGRGRTARECHDRWTRYLKPGARKGQWKEEEDATVLRVIAASSEHPFTQWADLAPQLPGRSGKQIRDRWVNYLNPAINHMPFSKEDDLRLWEGHKELGKRWVEISVKVFDSSRSENHIKNRWYSAAFKKFIASEFGPNAYVDALSAPAPSASTLDTKSNTKT